MADVSNSKLLQISTGILNKNACIIIVKTEWNSAIIDELENGCKTVFVQQGMTNYKTLTVPGAFEIPFAIKNYWDTHQEPFDRPAAFIALGCVVRGGTPHFEYVCKAITDGVVQLNLSLPVPTIFGVLTVDTQQQAEERIGGIHGHKGEEAAITAIKMIALAESFQHKR
jgi:6,7-dimethyl-8-ribityllumazine synthase